MWVTCASYRQGFHLASEGKATAGKPVASLQGHDSISKAFFIPVLSWGWRDKKSDLQCH